MKGLGYVLYGIYVLSTLWILVNALAQLHLLWLSRRKKQKKELSLEEWPFITIQVPVYNERYIIAGLLEKLALLDYPRTNFEIQVLDDSTDETSSLIEDLAFSLRSSGIDITIIRRHNRLGYKAGALQNGLQSAKGDYIAIFDADFQPTPDFLKRMLPHLKDEKVGIVQARWGHLNNEQNYLTRIQTYLLDMHFMVEQEGRYNAGYFINFCGTAGIWRRQCIIDAGGWDGSVLSEDLDLSYRAQLSGWKIVYEKNVVVPAQIPSVVEAFKVQQFRWTKGIAQTARKTLHRVWNLQIPLSKKLHSTVHLLSSFTFVCLFTNGILSVPLLLYRHHYPEFVQLMNYTVFGALNIGALGYLYYKSTASHNRGMKFLAYYPIFIVVYLAMSAQNAVAVMQGMLGMKSAFVRTPKFNDAPVRDNPYRVKKITWLTYFEIGLLLYFLAGIGMSVYTGDYFLFLYFLMIGFGLGILTFGTIKDWLMAKTGQHPFAPGLRLGKLRI